MLHKVDWPSDEHERLFKAVVDQLGGSEEEVHSNLLDITEHGIDGGFGGFTYYSDTGEFYEKNKEELWEVLSNLADDMGIKPLEIITQGKIDVETSDAFENFMAWMGAEEIARIYSDSVEEEE